MSIRVVLYRYYSCLKNIMICFSFLFIFLSDNLFYPIEEKEGRTLDDNKKKMTNFSCFLLFPMPPSLCFSRSLLFAPFLLLLSLSLSTSHCRFFQIVLRSFAYRAYAHLTSNALSNGK